MAGADPGALIARRSERPPLGRMGIRVELQDYAIVSWAVPPERLRPHVPERFALEIVRIDGEERALLSAVMFMDVGFHFPRLMPWPRLRFGQTNHRVYVRDPSTGEPAVWFLGTTLGSPTLYIARAIWRLPWHPGRYREGSRYDAEAGRFSRFEYTVESRWCGARLALEDTGVPLSSQDLPGFDAPRAAELILTHPVRGFFPRTDSRVGTYTIWHAPIPLTIARPLAARFDLYPRLGILSAEEVAAPHSALVCPSALYEIHLPPRRV